MKNPLFLFSLLFLIMLFSVPSFAEDTNIRILEKKELMGSRKSWNPFVHRMCVGGTQIKNSIHHTSGSNVSDALPLLGFDEG